MFYYELLGKICFRKNSWRSISWKNFRENFIENSVYISSRYIQAYIATYTTFYNELMGMKELFLYEFLKHSVLMLKPFQKECSKK